MGTYSSKIPLEEALKLKELLKEEDCVFSTPQYTIFQAKAKNWQITFYKTGKVLVQGKEIDYILEKYFEKPSTAPMNALLPYPHTGIDESGKGDFFGPLVIAGCFLNEENALKLKEMGADDSKKMNDKAILDLVDKIKELSVYDVVVIGNKKYNELYSKFKNLNSLLAWGHATVLENILNKTECSLAISDKFADEKVIINALKEKGKGIKLIQQTKAESDTAVACASILARAEFVKRISKLSYDYGIDLPKGAGANVLAQGRKFVEKFGAQELKNAAKTHFKTYNDIICAQKSFY